MTMGENKDYCVIMCGGIGSRFWPFSRKQQPKQFLDFLGIGRSMLQLTYDRFSKVIPRERIIIATNADYIGLVKEQLPEIDDANILAEPARRNTAPCIAWAAYHIRNIDPEANMVVTPSDHIILKEEEFRTVIRRGLDFTRDNDVLLTIGIKPNRPETGYGYIQVDEAVDDNFYTVVFSFCVKRFARARGCARPAFVFMIRKSAGKNKVKFHRNKGKKPAGSSVSTKTDRPVLYIMLKIPAVQTRTAPSGCPW